MLWECLKRLQYRCIITVSQHASFHTVVPAFSSLLAFTLGEVAVKPVGVKVPADIHSAGSVDALLFCSLSISLEVY